MPLFVYSSALKSHRSSRLPDVFGHLRAQAIGLFAATLFACSPSNATAQQNAELQRRVPAACQTGDTVGLPMVRVQQRGDVPLSLCEGRVLGGGRLQSGSGDPVALASADLDADGVPDLISGFASGKGGSITIHRGNIQALWPYGAAALNGTPQAFFPDSRTVTLPERPDFLVTGDFDADGHWDVITAQRGSSAIYFLKGTGHGSLLAPKRIDVSGSVTAMIAGEMNRADGLADVILAVTTAAGPRALVYESPRGAVKAQPEIFKLPHTATALALGRFEVGGMTSLAIGAENQLLIVHGRDRKLSLDAAQRVGVLPAKITQQELPFAVFALVAGDFTGTGPSIAALGSDNRVHILEAPPTQSLLNPQAAADPDFVPSMQVANQDKAPASAGTMTPGKAAKLATLRHASKSAATAWTERSAVDLPSGFAQKLPQLMAARVAGSQQQEILALDSGNRQIHVLSTEAVTRPSQHQALSAASVAPQRSPMKLTASLQAQSAPAAVLPMRLGRHGLNGLVMLQANTAAPILMPHDVPPANIFVVTNTLDITSVGGTIPPGSLRDAMKQVEAASGDNGGGSYEIDFNIPTTDPGYNSATGTFIIKPLSQSVPGALNDFALPPINATVTIDGYTQPGASPNTLANGDNAKILIQIDGSKATTPGGSGFVPFDDVGSVFRGMDFTGWINPDVSSGNTASGAWGIEANGVGDFIEGNFFGTDPTGKVAAPNRIGIFADNGPLSGSVAGNIIGGTTPQARNILSGNTLGGILFLSTALEAQLQGNFIGLDATGTKAVPNNSDGAGLNGPTVTIGGTLPGAANYIAGNGTNVDLNDLTNGGAAKNSNVQGNFIGLNAGATAAIANQGYGVSILHGVNSMIIGGTSPAAKNVISGNLAGVYVFDNSFNNVVQGNYIGTDPAGTKAFPNKGQGILIGATGTLGQTGAGNTVVGGSVAGAGNLISGNTTDGISVSGVSQTSSQSPQAGNTIAGNLIGTTAAGTAALANGGSGISITGSSSNNVIGGSQPGSANFIAYNTANGVLIDPGTTGGGNQTIANIIQSNTGTGVRVVSGTGNRISQNSIFGNQALGIDVDTSGPNTTNAHCNTPNSGANNLQNFPVLTAGTGSIFITATATDPSGNTSEFSKTVAATKTGNVVSLLGSFDSTANTKFNIEFFSSPSADASGYGQGQTYLGSTTITTDANCMAGITDPIDLTQADVSVTLAQPYQLQIGPDMGFYSYTGSIANNGPATAHNVVFTDTLPSQLAVSSAYCNVASCQSPITTSLGACTVSGQKITCNLGTMAPGATATVGIPVQTVAAGTVVNTATVAATEVDPNLANNTSSPSASAYYPFPSIDSFSPASALVNSPDLPLTIYGEQILSSSTVTFNGTSLPVKGFLDNQVCGGPFSPTQCSALQVVVPASLLTTAGTPTVEVTNPDPQQGGNNFPSDMNFTVAASCTYNAFSFLDGETIDADGSGLIAENVSVGTNAPSCPWTATSSVPWAVILDNASAVGTGSVDINVGANTGTATRTGTVTVAGTTFTFTQPGGSSCPNTLSSATASSPSTGGTGTVNVTTGSECAYFVEPYADWITIPKSSGLLVGSETASYVVAANHGAPRTGSVAVGASTLTITQQSPTCYFTLDTNSALIPVTGATGTIAVTASAPSCKWTATSSNTAQLSVTSGASGTGNGTVKYSLPANTGGPITPTLTIGDANGYSIFTATQSSAFTCTFTIKPTPLSVSSLGTSNFFFVTASYDFCKWTAASNDPTALTINQGTSKTGSGAVYYSVAKNTTDAARTLTITAGCQTFTINQDAPLASNPVPAITTLLPASVTAGTGAATLTVTGSNFVNGAVVNYGGTARVTTFVSATQVTAAILAADVATAGTFPVTVTNPTPGGGTSNSINFTVNPAATNNPVPTITTLQPASVTAGAGATMLTINGTNFVTGSIVNFNGAAKTTTFVSATQVKAALLAADVATAGTFAVTVTNPTPGGGASNSVNFTVNAVVSNNPVPTITTLQPASVTAGAGATTLTVNGTNFVSGSVVNFNGAAKATTFVSATQVTAALLAADVAAAGTFAVTVTNPTPGGGASNSVNFTVSAVVVNNPVPTVTALLPASATAGSEGTNISITGTNFIAGSVVNFNGTARTTTFVSATQLMASLLGTDLATAGTFPVTVTNPIPGGGTSAALNFTVNAVAVPAPQVSFNPTTLTFPSTSPTVASTAQTVTLTNSGNATLNITGITISGANAAAFTQTNECGATLAPEGSCTISVIFTPPTPGSFAASLSVADDASGSPQTVSLSGTGSALPSFTVSSTTTPQTVATGGAAQYSITVSAQNGTFPGSVAFSANGLPPGATATFNPATLSPGSSSATTQLTIQTAAPVATPAGFGTGWTITGAVLPMFALFLAIRKRRTPLPKLMLLFLASLATAAVLTGCGGGFGFSPTSTAKTYTVTVTGTSGENVQSTTVQLIVQ